YDVTVGMIRRPAGPAADLDNGGAVEHRAFRADNRDLKIRDRYPALQNRRRQQTGYALFTKCHDQLPPVVMRGMHGTDPSVKFREKRQTLFHELDRREENKKW